jgi:23S rRNA (uracil1939-C5)-methyltransferase
MKNDASPPAPLEVNISRVVPGGAGMGNLPDGRVAFVPGAFAGDRVRLTRLTDKTSHVLARDFDLLEASPDRVAPRCPVVASCGGCDWMALSQGAQLEGKKSLIEQALRRTGGFEPADYGGEVLMRSAGQSFGYRTRVRLQVGGGRVGFFARASHELVEAQDCTVASPALLDVMQLVRQAVSERPSAFEAVQYVEARALHAWDGSTRIDPRTCSAHFVFSTSHTGEVLRRAWAEVAEATKLLSKKVAVRVGEEPAPVQSFEPIFGVTVKSPPGAFTQVHAGVNRRLVERVLEIVSSMGASTFVDLFCGSGNFSLPLALRGLSGVGVESNLPALEAARQAAAEQNAPVEFVHAKSSDFVARAVAESRAFDLVLVDPPRSGAREVLEGVLSLCSPLLVMISCDPVTLARDLRVLTAGGYEIRQIEGFDMFPQTHHVETLAVLQPSKSARLSLPAS